MTALLGIGTGCPIPREPLRRWPGFDPAALAVGAAAVFGFPLRAGGARIGTLNLYRDRPGALSGDQFADARVAAEVIARRLVILRAGAATTRSAMTAPTSPSSGWWFIRRPG